MKRFLSFLLLTGVAFGAKPVETLTLPEQAVFRSSIGFSSTAPTTIGKNLIISANPGAIAFPQAQADNTILWNSQAAQQAALGITELGTTTPGTGVATFLATPSSANLATAVTNELGSGSLLFGDQTVSTTSSPSFASVTVNGNATLQASSANTMTLRNGVNAQNFRVANTWTSDTNYELGIARWSSNVFQVGTEKGSGGGTARDLALVTDGTTRLTIGATSGNLTIASGGSLLVTNGGVRVPSGNYVYWDGRSRLTSSTDGVINLYNASTNGFTRLAFGPDTSSFPAIGRNGTGLEAQLGDGSAGTTFKATDITATGDLLATTAGKGLRLKSGSNQRAGNATLVAGTVTVNNTTVTANTLVHLTRKTAGGTIGDVTYTLSAGASFTITSDSGSDTSTFTYLLTELD